VELTLKINVSVTFYMCGPDIYVRKNNVALLSYARSWKRLHQTFLKIVTFQTVHMCVISGFLVEWCKLYTSNMAPLVFFFFLNSFAQLRKAAVRLQGWNQ